MKLKLTEQGVLRVFISKFIEGGNPQVDVLQKGLSKTRVYNVTSVPIAGFQFLDLYLTYQILTSSIMTSSFVWNEILLLCPFHQVLVYWE